ncbi:MAG: malate synthase A [Acidobacteriota bacterium]
MTTAATLVETPSVLELAPGVELHTGADTERARRVLTDDAVALIAELHRQLDGERRRLLAERVERAAAWDAGEVPTYFDRTSEAAAGEWRVAPVPADLQRRRVEITGPVNDAKMVIKMLSRNEHGDRADAAMVDFEDSMKPSWINVIDGVLNVIGVAKHDLTHVKPAAGGKPERRYALDPADMAKLLVRVRGLHLAEANLTVDGDPVSGGLLDFALVLFHTGRILAARGETPAFYVPKVEHPEEARWWNQLFTVAQRAVGLEVGTLRATFLMETLPAAFAMEEILYEIREHAAGLNVGRWDKIFSDIKVLKNHPDRVLADRASISLNRPWMRDYAARLIEICHRRGAYAIGGMAAFTPGKTADLRQHQTSKVLEDKKLEFELGHDGCWVSHPYFIGPALSAFPKDNQLEVRLGDDARYPELLPEGGGPRTLGGLRTNVRVGIAYLEGWRRDLGCVAWDGLMEDLATLEISRAQVWQWLKHGVELDDGTPVTLQLVETIFAEELARIHAEITEGGGGQDLVDRFTAASAEAQSIFLESEFRPFLTSISELA